MISDAPGQVDVTSVNDTGHPDTLTVNHPRPEPALRQILTMFVGRAQAELAMRNTGLVRQAVLLLGHDLTDKAALDLADEIRAVCEATHTFDYDCAAER